MRTVLVVDDEELLREIWQEQFSSEGFKVLTASSGDEGIEQIKNNKIDIVVTDLKMPKSSGIKLLEYIKNKR